MNINFVIPCLLGMEKIISNELKIMECQNVICDNGKVYFSGNENILARVNICSRYAERVQILLGSFFATSFEELFEQTKSLPFEEFLTEKSTFPVKGYSLNSKLFSVRDCQSIIKKAIVERLKQKFNVNWFEETGSKYQIQFSIMKDKVEILIDTTGVALHKRGYRLKATEAPIKETLAASLCEFSRLRENHTFYDPMCGSGTIAIEAALKACKIAPGINRKFAFEEFYQFDKAIVVEERQRAKIMEKRDNDFRAYAFDIDENALSIAEENAKRAGVYDKISFVKRDIENFEASTERGTLITNPPYGERLLDTQEVENLYRIMGEKFISKRGWSYSIISPDEDFEKIFGRKADKDRKIYNGMIMCRLYVYYK